MYATAKRLHRKALTIGNCPFSVQKQNEKEGEVKAKAIPNHSFCLYGCIKNLKTGYEGVILYIFYFIVVAKYDEAPFYQGVILLDFTLQDHYRESA